MGDGVLRLTIAAVEREVLTQLPEQLRAIVEGGAHDTQAERLRARLFPPASEDPETDAAYQELVGSSLADERVDLLGRFEASLRHGRKAGGSWTTELDAEDAHAWMVVVNDARLVLGSVVGIHSEADWERGPNPEDPQSLLLWWLGWLEEQLVQALTAGLDA